MVASRVELVAAMYPNVMLAPIVIATVAGCGGGWVNTHTCSTHGPTSEVKLTTSSGTKMICLSSRTLDPLYLTPYPQLLTAEDSALDTSTYVPIVTCC